MIMGAGAGPGVAAAARGVRAPGVRLRRGEGREKPDPEGARVNRARSRPARDFGAPGADLKLLPLRAGFSFGNELLAPPT